MSKVSFPYMHERKNPLHPLPATRYPLPATSSCPYDFSFASFLQFFFRFFLKVNQQFRKQLLLYLLPISGRYEKAISLCNCFTLAGLGVTLSSLCNFLKKLFVKQLYVLSFLLLLVVYVYKQSYQCHGLMSR